MTDIEELREEVLGHLREAKDGDHLAQTSASGLMMMFNKLAPGRAIREHEWGGETFAEKLPRLMEQRLAAQHEQDLELGRGQTCARCGEPQRGCASEQGAPLCHPSCDCHPDCYLIETT